MDISDGKKPEEGYGTNMQHRFKTISTDLRRYIEKRMELVQLEIADRLSLLMARSLHKLAGLVLLMFAYVFLMLALARYLGPLLGHSSYGYLIVGGLTGLLGFILAAVRPDGLSRRLQRRWMDQVFNSITEPENQSFRRNKYKSDKTSHPETESSSSKNKST